MKRITSITLFITLAIFNIAFLAEAERGTNAIKSATGDLAGKGTPRIQFETNFFDFGKISTGEMISGTFRFKNVGDGILKVEPPEASCECTVPAVKPDSLAPGESGEIVYTIKMERAMNGQRYIKVHSNDPKTPVVKLTMQMDYTPLYQLSPKALQIILPPGKDEVSASFTVTRGDGKPLSIDRLISLEEWINPVFDPPAKPQDVSAQVKVTIHRPPGPPAPFSSLIQMWSSNQPSWAVQSIPITGEAMGEVAAVPARIYWVIPDFGTNKNDYPAEALSKKIKLISVLGHDVKLTNPSSSIKGLNAEIITKQPGKTFELFIKFDELPQQFTNGTVSVETSLASLPRLEVPMTISVPERK